nr:MAG TPA: hypothetical protein [Caudoviricetes sp.]
MKVLVYRSCFKKYKVANAGCRLGSSHKVKPC